MWLLEKLKLHMCGVVFLVVGQPWIKKKSLGHYGSGATKQGPSKFISTQFTGPMLTVTQLGEEVLSLLGALEVKIMVFAFHNYVRVPQVSISRSFKNFARDQQLQSGLTPGEVEGRGVGAAEKECSSLSLTGRQASE